MADLSPTTIKILETGSRTERVTLDSNVNEFDVLAKDAVSGEYKQASAANANDSQVEGIALHDGDAGGQVTMLVKGKVDFGITLQVGELYVVSATAGKIAPIGDLTTGDYTALCGYGETASAFVLNFLPTGAAHY